MTRGDSYAARPAANSLSGKSFTESRVVPVRGYPPLQENVECDDGVCGRLGEPAQPDELRRPNALDVIGQPMPTEK